MARTKKTPRRKIRRSSVSLGVKYWPAVQHVMRKGKRTKSGSLFYKAYRKIRRGRVSPSTMSFPNEYRYNSVLGREVKRHHQIRARLDPNDSQALRDDYLMTMAPLPWGKWKRFY